MNNVIARWETRGKDWLELFRLDAPYRYQYKGNGCGGVFFAKNDEDAIGQMEAPWGDPRGTGQVTVLKSDRPSLRRVK
jgi:hypothetical protein